MLRLGDEIGHCEILALIGAGGMGEVYRARDTRLGRLVAVKTLPHSLAPDPVRLARLGQEARLLASLNHPGIATLYGIERTRDGMGVLVMELVDGPSLIELVPQPVAEALDMAYQIAAALEAAHSRGVLHRDLKPSNIRMTADGRLKLLDFGIATVLQTGLATDRRSDATLTVDAAGTPGYMSPEQLRGLELDRRSDVWSFGCVFFELLTGRSPFPGSTVPQIVASQLEGEPDWGALPEGTPDPVRRLLERCLRKKREQRLQDIGDARLELEELLRGWTGRVRPSGAGDRRPYPGLLSFKEADAAQFFGREEEVEALWRRLESRSLLAVIGPSGAGKTSFVRAGIVASRPAGWTALVTNPGTSPLLLLGQALAPLLASDPEALRHLLRFEDPAVAHDLVTRWRQLHGQALLIVDQFEELFTQCPAADRARFASLLGRLAAEGQVHVLLSMRDDFLMRCQEHPPLLSVFDSIVPLGPLTGPALRRAITEPAARLGVYFEDDALAEEMLASVKGERGALPLLAFAMQRLWEMRDRETNRLTRQAYEQIGGVSGALAHHAEATLARIGSDHVGVVRDLFRCLMTSHGTRAEADREGLLGVCPDRAVAEAVLDRLINARLLTSYELPTAGGQPGGHRIEIVHESLLRAWPRLVRWQSQDAEALVARDQLRQAAELWAGRGRPGDLLWRGTAYREFELWRERYTGSLTTLEAEFAEAMVARDRRARWRARYAVAGLVAASLTVAALVGVSRQQEVTARRLAEASRLAALGRLELDVEPSMAIAYARRSLAIHDTPEARLLAAEALGRGPTARVLPLPAGVSCGSLAASPDGRWLACGSWGAGTNDDVEPARRRSARVGLGRDTALWSEEGRRQEGQRGPDPIPFLEKDGALSMAWTRVGGWTLAPAADATPLAADPAVTANGALQDVDPLGNRLLFSRGPALWLRQSGRETLVGRHASAVRSAGLQDTTGAVVSVDEGNEIRVWMPASPQRTLARRALDAGLFSFPRLSPDGDRLAWHSVNERAAVLWDLVGPPDAAPLLLRRRSIHGNLGDTVFLGDGHWLASAVDDAVVLWPLDLPWPRVLRGHASAIVEIAFTPDSKRLVSCGNDGARVWPLVPGAGDGRAIPFERPYTCYAVAIDPTGEQALVAATTAAGFLASLEGEMYETLVRTPPTESLRAAALDREGRWAAVAAVSSPHARDRRLHLVDRRTHEVKSYPLPGATDSSLDSGGVYALSFTPAGRLLSVGDDGVRSWDLATGESRVLYAAGCGTMGTSADGRRVVVSCVVPPSSADRSRTASSTELLLIDPATGAHWPIEGHGRRIQSVAIDPSGTLVATGGNTGIVQVSKLGEEGVPHLLLGARGVVSSVRFSTDGRLLAAAAGTEVWLWPLPDLSSPPLQSLPHDELLAKLDRLTNLRLVEDDSVPGGYRADVGPFPGWLEEPRQ